MWRPQTKRQQVRRRDLGLQSSARVCQCIEIWSTFRLFCFWSFFFSFQRVIECIEIWSTFRVFFGPFFLLKSVWMHPNLINLYLFLGSFKFSLPSKHQNNIFLDQYINYKSDLLHIPCYPFLFIGELCVFFFGLTFCLCVSLCPCLYCLFLSLS